MRLAFFVDAARDSLMVLRRHEIRFWVSNRAIIEKRIDHERVVIDGCLLRIRNLSLGLLRCISIISIFLGRWTKRASSSGASPSKVKQAAALVHNDRTAERVGASHWRLFLARQGCVTRTSKRVQVTSDEAISDLVYRI